MIRTARAAILARSRSDLVVAEVDLPHELSIGQVLVKVEYSGVCATQIREIDAGTGPDRYLPHLLGHEGSGYVLKVGVGVKTVASGDSVVLHWRPGAGFQSETPTYRWRDQRLNAGWVTTFNSYAVVSENRLTRVPVGLDARRTPMLGCAITTAFGAVGNEARLKVGESVVILGTGGVGLAAVHACHLASAYPIVAVDIHSAQLDAARALGATHCIQLSPEADGLERIREAVGEAGADVVIEASGSGTSVELAYSACAPHGRTVLIGLPDPSDRVSLDTWPLHLGKTLIGSIGGRAEPHLDIPRLAGLIEANRLRLEDFPITEYSLDDINAAIAAVRSGAVGRQIIRMHD